MHPTLADTPARLRITLLRHLESTATSLHRIPAIGHPTDMPWHQPQPGPCVPHCRHHPRRATTSFIDHLISPLRDDDLVSRPSLSDAPPKRCFHTNPLDMWLHNVRPSRPHIPSKGSRMTRLVPSAITTRCSAEHEFTSLRPDHEWKPHSSPFVLITSGVFTLHSSPPRQPESGQSSSYSTPSATHHTSQENHTG